MKIFSWYRTKGLWWFRIFGYGIHYKNVDYHAELFSERNRIRKKLRLGKHRLGVLKRDRTYIVTGGRSFGKCEDWRQYYYEGEANGTDKRE
jgi:hypothetical protein